MRFVWAVAAFVLATLMIGAGIAQRTIMAAPKSESQTITIDERVPYVVIDGAVLNSHDGSQKLRVQRDGTIFAAYGRTDDMTAWLSTSDYVRVSLDDEHRFVTEAFTAPAEETSTPGDTGDDTTAEDAPALSPVDSDLWLDQFQQDDLLITALQLPDEMSLMVAADGVEPAPRSLTLTWPTGVTTPWAGPLIVGGGILMAVGIVLYLLGLRHVRRSRGPRRKGLPLPATEPIDLSAVEADKGVISATPTRRQLSRGRRGLVAVPAVAVSALLFTGCTADAWPQFGGTPTAAPSETVVVPADQGSPAVTQTQAERILARIAQQVATADETLDADAAAVRLDGPALAARQSNYTLRAAIPEHAPLAAVAAKPLSILLPQAYDGWPRTFLAVVENAGDGGATIVTVTQQDPWSDYKLTYTSQLAADVTMNLAPSYVGAVSVPPDSPFLTLQPDEVAAAYADVIDNGDASRFAGLFDIAADPMIASIAADRARRLEAFQATGAQTGELSFAAAAGTSEPVSLATLDSGAIVAVTVNESESVKPTNADAVIKVDDNAVVKALTGVTQSATGFTTTYADQLFFFVPAQSSSQRIQLLGYTSNILEAKVIS